MPSLRLTHRGTRQEACQSVRLPYGGRERVKRHAACIPQSPCPPCPERGGGVADVEGEKGVATRTGIPRASRAETGVYGGRVGRFLFPGPRATTSWVVCQVTQVACQLACFSPPWSCGTGLAVFIPCRGLFVLARCLPAFSLYPVCPRPGRWVRVGGLDTHGVRVLFWRTGRGARGGRGGSATHDVGQTQQEAGRGRGAGWHGSCPERPRSAISGLLFQCNGKRNERCSCATPRKARKVWVPSRYPAESCEYWLCSIFIRG